MDNQKTAAPLPFFACMDLFFPHTGAKSYFSPKAIMLPRFRSFLASMFP